MRRRFAFMDWPGFESEDGRALLAEVQPKADNALPPIQASDRDAGAIKMAQANAERAGVADGIEFTCRAVSAIQPPQGPGWVVTNPPYGLRVSAGQRSAQPVRPARQRAAAELSRVAGGDPVQRQKPAGADGFEAGYVV